MGVFKRIIAVTCALILIGSVLTVASMAQDRVQVSNTYNGKEVSIDYGRPELKGRDMLGRATPGMEWRFGMNQATALTTEATLHFGSVAVPAGSYTLVAKKLDGPGWELIIRGESSIPAVPFEVSATDSSVEQFTIELEGEGSAGALKASWGDTVLTAAFTVH